MGGGGNDVMVNVLTLLLLMTMIMILKWVRNEWNYLFNDAVNTFTVISVHDMVKDNLISERQNQLSPHGLPFPICRKWFFYMHYP